MCKIKYSRYQTDDLADMISSTVLKINNSFGDLRRRVLLTSVRKTLKSELFKKERRLKRKYQVLMSAMQALQTNAIPETTTDAAATSEETHEDILGLDDFFSSLRKFNSPSGGEQS